MTVNMVKECFILVYFTSAFMFINVSKDYNIKEPLLFEVIFDKNMSAYTLTCELSERPVGGAILVQVNFSSVDSIRHKNNSCYAKDGECQNDTCLCSYEGGKFGMKYWYKTPNVSQSYNFGVEMILKDGKANIVVVTLSRTYNGKDFGKLQIDKEVTEFNSNENIDVANIGVENNANRLNIWKNVTRLIVVMVLIIVFSLICFCMYHETSFKNKAKTDYQLLSLSTEEGTYNTIYASEVSPKTATVIQLSNIVQNVQNITDEIRSMSIARAKIYKKRIDCASEVSPKTANSDATVIQLSNVLPDFQIDKDEIRSKSTVPDKVYKKKVDCASGDKTANGNNKDTTVIQLSYLREDCQMETNQISLESTLSAKINDLESEVSFKTAKSDATVIALSNLRENVFETSIQKCSGLTSSCCEEQRKFIFSGLIASQSRTRGIQELQFQPVTLSVKNGLFSIKKAPSVLIDFSRQKSLDLMHHLYIQHIRFVLFMWYDFSDFSFPKIHRNDVLKELSNQIGKSAFHLRIELGASFYYIDGSFLKFLKTLAASLWKRNAESKLPLTYFSIDELKRVNGGGDKYILKMSK